MMNTDGNLNLHVKKVKFNYKFTRYHYMANFYAQDKHANQLQYVPNLQVYKCWLTIHIQASYFIDVHPYLLPGLLDSQCTRKLILK